MRLFVGSVLGADQQAFYERALAPTLTAFHGLLHPIPRGSAHITWAFLGSIEERDLAIVTEAVRHVASGRDALDIELGPPAVLFGGRDARLICAPVTTGSAAATHLAADVLSSLQRALPNVDMSGMKSPHVTLARFRKHATRASARPVTDALARKASTLTPPPDRIDCVQVISSDLTALGPVYNVRSEARLSIA